MSKLPPFGNPLETAIAHFSIWTLVAYASLQNFQKIPFTCSYFPGKSAFHMAFLAAIGGLILIGRGVNFEVRALGNVRLYVVLAFALLISAAALRWRALAAASEEAIVQFDEQPEPRSWGSG